MKKTILKSALALLLCVAMLLAVFAVYVIYKKFQTSNYRINEKLDTITGAIGSLLWNANNYPVNADHYDFDYSWVQQGQPMLIAHGLGGVDGLDCTNSLEALELAYAKGFKVFEVDFQMVDGELLLLNNLEMGAEMCGFDSEDFKSGDFLESSLYGEYTPMTWRDLLAFMAEHPDVSVITDTKYNEQPYMSYVIAALAAEAIEIDEDLLDRVVVQVYSQRMLDVVMDIYPFKSVIYTLYMSLDSNERVKAFCAKSGVKAVTMPLSRCDGEFLASLDAMGISSFTHTVNDPQQAVLLLESGIKGLYTDFLAPEDMAS